MPRTASAATARAGAPKRARARRGPELSPNGTLAKEDLLSMYRFMVMMRELEDRIELKLYRQGKIVGGCYTGRGQEAIPVGATLLSEPDDYICPSHRDMGAFLVRGVTPREILAQYLGRATGLTGGRDGNMHMGCSRRRLLPIISSIGASIPVAAGIALSMKYRSEPNIVFNFWGDGASSRGDWHEGLNFAAVQKLPIVYLCNNNLYAYSIRKGANPDMSLVFKHYNEALRLDPKHRGAHEYIGEAYLMVGNLAKAKEHLGQLDKLCFFPCSEFGELKKAIATYEAKRQ